MYRKKVKMSVRIALIANRLHAAPCTNRDLAEWRPGVRASVDRRPAYKHAVTRASSWSITDDTNGNMTTRVRGTISWYSYYLVNTINSG